MHLFSYVHPKIGVRAFFFPSVFSYFRYFLFSGRNSKFRLSDPRFLSRANILNF